IACPADATLRIRASDGYDTGTIVLPCGKWRPAGRAYRYVDPLGTSGGVRSVVYARKRLVVQLRGASFPALVGPLAAPASIEVELSTGARTYCARFETFKRNQPGNVLATRPSVPCVPAAPTPSPTPTATPTPTPSSVPTPAPECPAGM